MIPLQIISLIFGLYMLYWSFLSYKKRLFYLNELTFWILVWSSFIFVTLFPDTVKLLLQTFKISRTMDLLMIISFMILWFVSFRNYIENLHNQKKIYEMIRQDALSRIGDKPQKKSRKK